jgi:hypothetical protein
MYGYKQFTARFFILDNNSAYVKQLREHEAHKKKYTELVEEFCARNGIKYISFNFRSDTKLFLRTTYEENYRLRDEYGSSSFSKRTVLGRMWANFLTDNGIVDKLTPLPRFVMHMPWPARNFQSNGFEYCGHIYIIADGDGIEDMTFPGWCRETTGETFYRILAKSVAEAA